jgi:hypothetical protein
MEPTDVIMNRAIATMRARGLIPGRGEKAVDSAYWPEVLDPNHRATHGRNGNVTYLETEAARARHLAKFQKNELVINPINYFRIGIMQNTVGEIIYVVDRHNNFYVGKKNLGHFHHSSFLGGTQVLAAGSMIIAAGLKIVEVNNHSGHYLPGLQQLKRAAITMQLRGADLKLIRFKFSPPTGPAQTWSNGVDMVRS